MDAPRYQHDCPECTFLGRFDRFDLYVCRQSALAHTVIARYDSEGAAYVSGLPLAQGVPELAEARRRALAAGHLAPPPAPQRVVLHKSGTVIAFDCDLKAIPELQGPLEEVRERVKAAAHRSTVFMVRGGVVSPADF